MHHNERKKEENREERKKFKINYNSQQPQWLRKICNNLIGYVQGVFIPKIVEDVLLKVMYRGVPMTKQASIEKGDTGF